MSGGYTASADELAAAAQTMSRLAEDLLDDNPDLSSTPLTAAGFGQAHGQHAEKYTAGVQTLWAAVSGYSAALSGLGTNLGSSGKTYTLNDHTETGVLGNAAGA